MQARGHEVALSRMEALRAAVAEKFPQSPACPSGRLRTGLEALDREHGGLRKGVVTELCGSPGSGQLFLAMLLDVAVRDGLLLGLVDGGDAFEPEDWSPSQLSRMLWVRARGIPSALQAADMLLRDGNLPLIVCDLQISAVRELRQIPASTWHRFQRLIEQTAMVFIVMTPQSLVQAAGARIAIRNSWRLADLARSRSELTLDVQIFERSTGMVPAMERTA